MVGCVWLIGGTQESAQLAIALMQANVPCWVTVTTEAARSLYPIDSNLAVWVGRLTAETMQSAMHQHAIKAILDASHPFAVEVSQLAIATATKLKLPYLRYERPSVLADLADRTADSSQAQWIDRIDQVLTTDFLANERVLLTLGYKPLALFRPWQAQATLFARILPSAIALNAALEAGFSPNRLIALRPPISAELERVLWQHWHISMVITKASGAPGGEDIKRQVAAELGIKLVAIVRPPIAYPQQTSDLETAIAFCLTQTPYSNTGDHRSATATSQPGSNSGTVSKSPS